jgi:hypothetical protein
LVEFFFPIFHLEKSMKKEKNVLKTPPKKSFFIRFSKSSKKWVKVKKKLHHRFGGWRIMKNEFFHHV